MNTPTGYAVPYSGRRFRTMTTKMNMPFLTEAVTRKNGRPGNTAWALKKLLRGDIVVPENTSPLCGYFLHYDIMYRVSSNKITREDIPTSILFGKWYCLKHDWGFDPDILPLLKVGEILRINDK